jgi:rhodanese-related sulfurtransferase
MEEITVEALKEKFERKDNFLLIDVREQWERDAYNLGGIHIPLGTLPAIIDDYQDFEDKEIVVYCKKGIRSATAQQFLKKNDFKQVVNLKGGIDRWKAKYHQKTAQLDE